MGTIMSTEGKVLIGIGLATIILVVGAALLVGGNSSPDKAQVLSKSQKNVLIRDNSHEEKVPGAKVTIVEFGDFQCPACGASYPIVSEILKTYKGKVNFVFRNYPLPIHNNAQLAAEAAEAAGAQGKFFAMYDALYTNQKEWGESNDPMKYLTKYASSMGLNVDKWKKDVQSKKFANIIKRDQDDGDALGVAATPTFFINGQVHEGGMPYNDFKAAVDAALKKAS